ncbi:carboxylate--amine ligase [Leptolyngbya sp. 'hensonii']|uniref:carboxylate--amine ligase n=1 Tax=Leptolyngbya sp. 'hensonii' TaxID=1922337 RepID=UPI00094F4A5D|nr:carboxylate--amine ligase [Leptolyngbya sp. 'hensonii']OLP19640.1 carboxylate--amine ligase [Leptolyngbya sp. 'hensonii']
MKPLTIAVTGINAVDNPGPGTGVARSLREAQLPMQILGLAYDVMEPGLYMDWLFDRRFIMPYPSAEPDLLLERLEQIQQQVGLDCVIPNFDLELPLYIRCGEALQAMGIHTYLPTKEQFSLRHKARLVEAVAAFGGHTPRTFTASSIGELRDAAVELGFPLMIKGPYYQAYRVTNQAELLRHFHALAAEWGYPIILQQIVIGTELNLVGVGDGAGGHLGLVAIKKMGTTDLGKIWSGVTIDHPGLLATAEAFLRHTRWRGPFELECIADRDGRIDLIEINPRFPAWTYFATGVGVNLPARLVGAALGLPLPPIPSYEAGKFLMRYTYEIVTDTAPLQTLVTLGER